MTAIQKVKDEWTKRLREAYDHPHVKAIVNVLGSLPEGIKSLSISELEKRIPALSRKEIITASRKLGSVARFKTGRRGYDSRIEHWASLRWIYDRATGKA